VAVYWQVMEKVCAVCPDAIFDFDVTDSAASELACSFSCKGVTLSE
jgi:hypothetical protein